MMYREPDVLRALLERLTEMTVAYLNAQIEAGAQAVQLFDTWAGSAREADYRALDPADPPRHRRASPPRPTRR